MKNIVFWYWKQKTKNQNKCCYWTINLLGLPYVTKKATCKYNSKGSTYYVDPLSWNKIYIAFVFNYTDWKKTETNTIVITWLIKIKILLRKLAEQNFEHANAIYMFIIKGGT